MNLSSTIKAIQDIMRKDAGVDGDAQRISQLGWLFFLKVFDDREKELDLLEDEYQSPIPDQFRWRNWAAKPGSPWATATSPSMWNGAAAWPEARP